MIKWVKGWEDVWLEEAILRWTKLNQYQVICPTPPFPRRFLPLKQALHSFALCRATSNKRIQSHRQQGKSFPKAYRRCILIQKCRHMVWPYSCFAPTPSSSALTSSSSWKRAYLACPCASCTIYRLFRPQLCSLALHTSWRYLSWPNFWAFLQLFLRYIERLRVWLWDIVGIKICLRDSFFPIRSSELSWPPTRAWEQEHLRARESIC